MDQVQHLKMLRFCNPLQTQCPAEQPGLACLKTAPLGAAAVAVPVTALVAPAVSRMGAPAGGMASGRLLEAGTRLLPTIAVATTVYFAPAARPVSSTWVDVPLAATHCDVAVARHALTMYLVTAEPVVGGDSRTRAAVVPVGFAAATVGAPSRPVRITRLLLLADSCPELLTPTTRTVSAGKSQAAGGIHSGFWAGNQRG